MTTYFADPKYVAPAAPKWVAATKSPMIVGDYNGDGVMDVAITGDDFPSGAIPSQLQIWLGQAGGGYVLATSTVTPTPVITYFTRTTSVGDFNGDGKTDIFLGTVGNETLATGEPDAVLLSGPGGTLTRISGTAIDRPNYSHGSSIGDIDGDGDLDIYQSGGYVVGGNTSGPTIGSHLLLNDGKGNFTDATASLPAALQAPNLRAVYGSAIADLNGDGKGDLIVGSQGGTAATLSALGKFYTYTPTGVPAGYYLNDGHGGFGAFQALPSGALPNWNSDTVAVKVFDANGDGIPDLLLSSYNAGVIMNASGTLTFVGANDTTVNLQGTSRDLQLFFGDGKGGFTDASANLVGANNGLGGSRPLFQLYIVDLNGDGKPDIVGSPTGLPLSDPANGVMAWLNTGDGHFTPVDVTAILPAAKLSQIYSITAFDANGDGLADIAYQTQIGAGNPSFSVQIAVGDPALTLTGAAAGGQTLVGGSGGDTITATAGSNILHGEAGSDIITGGSGSDRIWGDGGNDTIDGGGGVDTAVYQGKVSQYTVANSGGAVTVTDNSTDMRDGIDTLTNVEQLAFADTTLVLDLHSAQDLTVYKLYQAAFARTPDNAGYRYWATQADAQNLSALKLADAFLASPEFTQKYGASPTDLAYATAMYTNVLQRTPDAAGLAYWVGNLTKGEARDQLLVDFATSSENATLIGSHTANGYWTT